MEWFDEMRLSRHSIFEIGMVFYIREMMRNAWTASEQELRETFGQQWYYHLERLRRNGLVQIVQTGALFRLSVVARGDKRREKLKQLASRKRMKQGKGVQHEKA